MATSAIIARRRGASLRLEHVVMGAAVAALIVLVVLPLAFLVVGSVAGEGGLSIDNFVRAMQRRLYYQALLNSLVLGARTGPFSLVIGFPLAWAVSRTNTPGKGVLRLTANPSYLTPPVLTAVAFVTLFGPNAGVVHV